MKMREKFFHSVIHSLMCLMNFFFFFFSLLAFLPPLKNIFFSRSFFAFRASHLWEQKRNENFCERKCLNVVVWLYTMREPYKLDGSRKFCVRMLTQSWKSETCFTAMLLHLLFFILISTPTSSMKSAPLYSAYLEATKCWFFRQKLFSWVIKKVLNGAIKAMEKLWLNIAKYFTILG